jgi:inorganic pyrophosphatase
VNLYKISTHQKSPIVVNTVIEIPKGCSQKYEYDPKGYFKYDRSLNTAMVYPANYGFIPNTIAEDGDALDVILYNQNPIARGTVVESRVLGVLDMEDEGLKDYKILAIPVNHIGMFSTFKDAPQSLLKIYKNFFSHYKDLEGKKVLVKDWHKKDFAYEVINNCAKTK